MVDDLASGGDEGFLLPEDLSILAGVESAIAGAVELEAWWTAVDAADAYDERFDLATTHNRPDEGFGFFGEARIGGAAVPVMGHVRQQLYDRPKMAAGRRETAAWLSSQVREFVLRYLLRVSGFQQPDAFAGSNGQAPPAYLKPFSWYPDGEGADVGFGFRQVFFKLAGDEEPRKFRAADRHAIVDLREIGKTYEWVVLEVDLFDFAFVFAPFGESYPHGRLPGSEPSYLVLSEAFLLDEEGPGEAGELGRYGFGYAFLPAKEGSILAYGLGQFEAAFQTVRFHVKEDGEVTARLAFAATRPKQVVKFQVDPVDWGLRLADRFSFGTASSVIEPMQKMWQRMPGAGGVDPVQAFITAANMVTSGGAARSLGVSRKQLHKNFLVAQFKHHYNVVAGSLATWRQIPDWLDRENLPDWAVLGESAESERGGQHMSDSDLQAVIFSGGGADGAYQIGVAKALFNGKSRSTYLRPLDPAVFTGTSIGSFNASFLVSQWAEYGAAAVANLEKVWLERMAWTGASNGGFRVRLNPFELLDPRPYLEEPFSFRPLQHLATDVGKLGWEAVNRTYNLFASTDPVLERLTDFFNLSSFVAVEPWERTIKESIDYKKIRESKKKLSIAATNWAFGEVREFTNGDMTDKLGPAAIRASSSVPGVYPPAKVGAQTYVDGAVLMNTPLRPAIKALSEILKQDPNAALRNLPYAEAKRIADQAEAFGDHPELPDLVLHVIYMNTEVEKMPIDALQSTLQTLYRTQIIGWASAVNQDILRSEFLNVGIELLRNPKMIEKGLSGKQLKVILESAESLLDRLKAGNPYRPLTIHRYFPPDGLDGALGFLDVRRERFKRLIDEGFHNTVAHDCETNQCILAGKHKGLILGVIEMPDFPSVLQIDGDDDIEIPDGLDRESLPYWVVRGRTLNQRKGRSS